MFLSRISFLLSTHMHKKETEQEIKTSYFKESLAAIPKFFIGQVKNLPPNKAGSEGKGGSNAYSHFWATAHLWASCQGWLWHSAQGMLPIQAFIWESRGTALYRLALWNFGYMKKRNCHLVCEPRKRAGHWKECLYLSW